MHQKNVKATKTKAFLWALFLGSALAGPLRAATDDSDLKLDTTDGSTQFSVQDSNAKNVFMVNTVGTIQVTSNTVLSGTTFYQNGNAIIGNAATSGENILLNGGITYGINDVGSVNGAVTFDVSKGTVQRAILIGNVTATISNAVSGQPVIFVICEDATGGRTFTWPTGVNVTGQITAINTTASHCNVWTLNYDGTNSKFYMQNAAAVNQT